MLVERSPVARTESDHGHRDRISLVLEKQRQVVRFHISELNIHERIIAQPARFGSTESRPTISHDASLASGLFGRFVQLYGVSPQEQMADDAIRAALARGEENSGALRERRGKPIDLDAYFNTPPELRMAFSMLKEGNEVPEELELLKEINRLKEQVASAAHEKTRSELRLKLSELSAVYEMKMQAYRREVPVTLNKLKFELRRP